MTATSVEYSVRARNTAAQSGNPVHDTAGARRLGLGGALVPGIALYAYMTHPVVAALGADWLRRGRSSVRFLKPVYEGEDLIVRATRAEPRAPAFDLVVVNPASESCATGTASLPGDGAPVIDLGDFPRADLPAERPAATREVLENLGVLGSPTGSYDERAAAEYLAQIADGHALYRGAGAWLHPSLLLRQSIRGFDQNVRLGAWIHVSSEVEHLGGARVGEALTTRGRIRGLSQRKGHELVDLEFLILAGRDRPVARTRLLAIYRMSPSS